MHPNSKVPGTWTLSLTETSQGLPARVLRDVSKGATIFECGTIERQRDTTLSNKSKEAIR